MAAIVWATSARPDPTPVKAATRVAREQSVCEAATAQAPALQGNVESSGRSPCVTTRASGRTWLQVRRSCSGARRVRQRLYCSGGGHATQRYRRVSVQLLRVLGVDVPARVTEALRSSSVAARCRGREGRRTPWRSSETARSRGRYRSRRRRVEIRRQTAKPPRLVTSTVNLGAEAALRERVGIGRVKSIDV